MNIDDGWIQVGIMLFSILLAVVRNEHRMTRLETKVENHNQFGKRVSTLEKESSAHKAVLETMGG